MSKKRKLSDGIFNQLLRLGSEPRAGNTFAATHYVPEFKTLNRQQLEWAYQGSWMCGLAVDIIAEDMTREGVEIKGADPDVAERIDTAFDDLGIWESLTDTIKWSRLYGGAIAVMMIDGEDMSQPLNVASIRPGSFRGLYPLDRWQIMPSPETIQKLGRNFGRPVRYEVLPGISGLQMPVGKAGVHHSRVLRFDGVRMPAYIRQAYQFWGASVLERVIPRIMAFDSATQAATQLLSKVFLRYYKVKGLRQILTNAQATKGFYRQMDLVREFQGIEGMTLGDAEDDFQTFNYSFTGLPDILLQFGQQVSGAIGVPLVRLFGQSPVGLNSTGEMDLRLYYDDVKRRQDSDLRESMKRLLRVMYASEFGRLPDDGFTFDFRPLWQMTSEAKANVSQTMTGAILQAYDSQLIGAARALDELRKMSESTGMFTTITDEDIREAEEADEADDAPLPDMGLGGMNGDVQAVQQNPSGAQVVQPTTAEGSGGGRGNRPASAGG